MHVSQLTARGSLSDTEPGYAVQHRLFAWIVSQRALDPFHKLALASCLGTYHTVPVSIPGDLPAQDGVSTISEPLMNTHLGQLVTLVPSNTV